MAFNIIYHVIVVIEVNNHFLKYTTTMTTSQGKEKKMTNCRNTEIKCKLKEMGVYQYELAEAMGVSEFTLVKRFRKEQSAEEKERINTIIDALADQKRGEAV